MQLKGNTFIKIYNLKKKSFSKIQRKCPNQLMTAKTWSRIGIQCLYSLKLLHDIGIVHRDIKPANFVLGSENDPQRARFIHILDFGLSRFAFLSLAKMPKSICLFRLERFKSIRTGIVLL